MENATWQAARAVRTGQLQQSTGSYTGATTNADRQKALKKAFCDKAFLFTDCNTKAVVIVQSNSGLGNITQPSCATNGVVVDQSTATFNAGSASSVVSRHRLLPLGFRRQVAAVQDGQPAGRRTLDAGLGRFPYRTLQLMAVHALEQSAAAQPGPDMRAAMPALRLSDLAIRAGALLRRRQADTAGIAAIEFAMIVPIMAVMFIGAVELSQAITVDRRVTQVASSDGRPRGPRRDQISQTEITDIMRVGGYHHDALHARAGADRDTQRLLLADATHHAKQSWSCTYQGAGSNTPTCACIERHLHPARRPREHQRQRGGRGGDLRLQAARCSITS